MTESGKRRIEALHFPLSTLNFALDFRGMVSMVSMRVSKT